MPTAAETGTKQCAKCKKVVKITNFYKKRDGSYLDLCKGCITMHIDLFKPESFLWILEKLDLPYIAEQWNVLVNKAYDKNADHPEKINPGAVFGTYVGKMKLRQWIDYGWADTERLRVEQEERVANAQKQTEEFKENLKEQFDNNEISEYEYKTLSSAANLEEDRASLYSDPSLYVKQNTNFYDETQFMAEDELPDPAAELTHEDKVYLALKWGRLYKPNEWITLEEKYNKFAKAFSIEDPDSEATLIIICKTDLKMNQAIDAGDTESYNKLARTYDTLRKSAKFTAAQNKDKKDSKFDSVGELVLMCEKDGFIPRFATDIPQDKVDFTLRDMNAYIKKLVIEDLGFGEDIENTIKKIQLHQEAESSAQQFDFGDDETEDDFSTVLSDADIAEHYEAIYNDKMSDQEVYYPTKGQGDN